MKLIFSKLSLAKTLGETDQFKICTRSLSTMNWASSVNFEKSIKNGPLSEADPSVFTRGFAYIVMFYWF